MLAEFLEKVRELAGRNEAPNIMEDEGGRQYCDGEIKPLQPPLITTLTVATLGALCDLWDKGFEQKTQAAETEEYERENLLIHVESFSLVSIVAKNSNKWAQRVKLATAKLPELEAFKFATYHEHAAFIIGVQSNFTQTEHAEKDDREYILNVASKITKEKVVSSEDTGFTQIIGMKQGAVLQGNVALKQRVQLTPFRTFREVTQPTSEFVFRVNQQGEGEIPKLALFEADGGKWKLDAVENIGRFLRTKLGETVAIII